MELNSYCRVILCDWFVVHCLSLFSGAGGLDIGAKKAGAKIIACVENEPDAAETLRQNFGETQVRVIEEDIAKVDFHEFQEYSDDLIVMGGPPCQPFSKNGYWVKNVNRLIEEDPRNLLGQFLRAVEESQPKGFIFENVESILHPSNKAAIEGFMATAEILGYKCVLYRANAADFGVPQRRKRVFVFGVKTNGVAIDVPVSIYSDHRKKYTDKSMPDHLGVGPFIKKYASKKYFEKTEIATFGTYFNELKNVPSGKNYMALSKLENYSGRTFKSGSRFWNFLHKLHPDEPSITVAAQPGPWVGPFHWDNRRLRVGEVAAIQTFPEDYKFYGSRRSVQKQIGNAVPCLLGEKMVGHLLEKI